MSDQQQEQVKEETDIPVQPEASGSGEQQSQLLEHHMGVDEAHALPNNKLFEGFYVALSHGDIDMDSATAASLAELQRKITEHGGSFNREINAQVNIFIVPSSNIVDTGRIGHAMKYSIPIVTEQYVHDSVAYSQRLDWNQYLVVSLNQQAEQAQDPYAGHMDMGQLDSDMISHAHQMDHSAALNLSKQLAASSTSTTNTITNNASAPHFTLKMYLKGSRQTAFSEQFPEVLYTLTWKHKYDVRIMASEKIFEGKNQSKIWESIEMSLVLTDKHEVPSYDDDESAKRKRKRPKNETTPPSSANTPSKRKQKKPSNTDTITISSLHKSGDDEIIIRFGINSTFCSKRFQYGAFKLFISYQPLDDPSDDYHFQIYSAEFKTFVKKNANITKYLHFPKPLDPTVTFITKAATTTQKVEYQKYMVQQYEDNGATSPGGTPRSQGKKRKTPSKGKRKRGADDDDLEQQDEHQAQWGMQQGDGMNQVGMYPFLPIFSNSVNMNQMPTPNLAMKNILPQTGTCWVGDPIGMNVNADMFYLAFCKDGVIYKINDFVYIAPDESVNMGEGMGTGDHPLAQVGSLDTQSQQGEQSGEQAAEQVSETQSQQEQPAESSSVSEEQASGTEQSEGDAQATESDTMQEGEDETGTPAVKSETEKYWICKIINLVNTKNEGMKFIGQWFYRWQDVQSFGCNVDNSSKHRTKKQYILQKDKEVFVSFDINYNSLSSVRGKCFVRYMDQEAQKNNKYKKWLSHKDHYFFQTGFNRLKSELFDLQEPMLKILRETNNYDEDGEEVGSPSAAGVVMPQYQASQFQPMMSHMALGSAMPQTLGTMGNINAETGTWAYQQPSDALVGDTLETQPMLQEDVQQSHDQ
jgi:hypothetical protein